MGVATGTFKQKKTHFIGFHPRFEILTQLKTIIPGLAGHRYCDENGDENVKMNVGWGVGLESIGGINRVHTDTQK